MVALGQGLRRDHARRSAVGLKPLVGPKDTPESVVSGKATRTMMRTPPPMSRAARAAFLGYFTLLGAELVNYGWWTVHLIQFHFEDHAANFVPFFIPTLWPVWTPVLHPEWSLSVLIASFLLAFLGLDRLERRHGPRARRTLTKLVAVSAGAFVAVYLLSFPLFWMLNAGDG